MPILDLFSKRMKRMRNEYPDVYAYDVMPQELRVQVVHLVRDIVDNSRQRSEVYDLIVKALRREYGVFRLAPAKQYDSDDAVEIFNFLLSTPDVERALDVVELFYRVIDSSGRSFEFAYKPDATDRIDRAIEELNIRFKEAGVGFQFEQGEILRVDSQLIHAEAVVPALRLLNTKSYSGAHQEFLAAYEHYRHGRTKEAINDALKAFESTMKAICDKRRWTYDPKDTASKLIAICFNHGLVPVFWQTELTSLKSLLESGVPTGRNKLSGHGQGSTPQAVPDHIAAYILHMTASTLLFLTTAEQKLP